MANSTNVFLFSASGSPAPFDIHAYAKAAIAAYRQAQFDPPTEDDLQTLSACEAIERLLDQLGAERFFRLAKNVSVARGEQP